MSAFQLIQTDAATAVSSRAPTKPVVLGSIDKTLNTPFAVVVQALPHKVYRLVEAQTQQPVKGQRLVRKGNNLLVEVDGAVMANLTGFFSNDAAPGSAQPGATPEQTKLAPGAQTSSGAQYVFDAELADGSYGLINHTSQGTAIADGSALMWAPGQTPAGVVNPQAVGLVPIAALGGGGAIGTGALLGGAAVVGAVALAGGGTSEAAASSKDNFVQGRITAGDVVKGNDLEVEVYAIGADGKSTLLKTGDVDDTGAYSINIGSYAGAVRLKIKNTGEAKDYKDEATKKEVNLSTDLEALAVVSGGSSVVTINITPLTHVASLKNTSPSISNITAINTAVGEAFGVDNIIDTTVITIDNPSYSSTDTSSGKKYGDVLAALSGLDTKTGSTSSSLTTVAANITVSTDTSSKSTATLNEVAKAKLVEGAQAVDSKTSGSTTNAVTASLTNLIGAQPQKAALDKIAAYADVGSEAPEVADYTAIAISGVNAKNLGDINALVKKAGKEAANESSEVQALVNLVNQDLTVIELLANALTENATGQVVGTLSVNDPEGNGIAGVVWRVSDTTNFKIESNKLFFIGASPDYETKSSYAVTVTSTDGSLVKSQDFTISVNDLNDNAPVFTSGATGTVVENAATTTAIYTAATTDADGTAANRLVAYSLKAGTGDVDLLDIDSATGAVTLKASANYEDKTSYSFTVVATNGTIGAGTQAAGPEFTTEKAVTVSVNDVNDNAPVLSLDNASVTLAENASAGAITGADADATDTDGTVAYNTIKFSIASGNDSGYFAIDENTGQVSLTAAGAAGIDYESGTKSYALSIQASDGVNTTQAQTLTINLSDVNDNAPIASNATNSATEDGVVVTGQLVATDTDSNTTLTFQAVGEVPAGLTLRTDGSYSFDPSNEAYQHLAAGATQDVVLTFKASDGTTASAEKTLTITITGTNDTPTLNATTASFNYANTAGSQNLFSVATADALDAGQTITGLTFTVTNLDGTSDEKFTVDGTEFSLTNATTGTTAANSVGYSVIVSGSTATVTLTKAAGLSATQTKDLVEGLAYRYATSGGMTRDREVTLTQITDSGSDNNVTTLALVSTVRDTTAPSAPTLSSVTDNDGLILGLLNEGDTTDDNTPTLRYALTGSGAVAGDNIQLRNGDTAIGTAQVLQQSDIDNGYVDITPSALRSGNYSFNAVLIDAAGNTSEASTSQDQTIVIIANQRLQGMSGSIGVNYNLNSFDQSIAALSDGGYVIAWSEETTDDQGVDVFVQRYTATNAPVGEMVRVQSQAGWVDDYQVQVAALANGHYVLTWTTGTGTPNDDADIHVQHYDANNQTVGAMQTLQGQVGANDSLPQVTTLGGGGYVLTWRTSTADQGLDILVQAFDANGNASGVQHRLQSPTGLAEGIPAVTALNDGGYVVSWSGTTASNTQEVFVQRYNAQSQPVGSLVQLSGEVGGTDNILPTSCALADGGYALAWAGSTSNGQGTDVFVQRFDSANAALGSVQRLQGLAGEFNVYRTKLAALSDGGFVLSWTEQIANGNDYDVFVQRFDEQGFKGSHTQHQLSGVAGAWDDPWNVLALPSGRYVVAWNDWTLGSGSPGKNICLQMYDAQDQAIGGVARLRGTEGLFADFGLPQLAALADGGYVVSFVGYIFDDFALDVFAQRFDANGLPVVDSQAPVVIDLNRDGVLSYSQAVIDVNRDGQLDHSAWVGSQDGLLVWDKFHDGRVHDASQCVFSQGEGQTDLQGLAAQFDTHRDGVFNAKDALFHAFSVWQDSNQNGVSDAGEMRSLADVGLIAIQLQSDGVTRQSAPGVLEAGRSSATASDGSSVVVGDVGFAFTSLTSVAASSAKEGQINLASDTSANLLQLRLQDLLALPEQNGFNTSNTQAISGTPLAAEARQLMITGDKTDVVKLDANTWSASNTVIVHAGHQYQAYTANTSHAQLLIDQTIINAGHVL